MTFAAPIWLLSLLPWAALTLWLMRSRRPRVDVPFIELWQETQAPAPAPAAPMRPPAVALTCVLLAMLLSLMAAGRPVLINRSTLPVTVIVDRGVTMSATSTRATLERFAARMLEHFGDGPVEVMQIPGTSSSETRSSWTAAVGDATGLNTRALLNSSVQHALASRDGPILVFANQSVDIRDERVTLFDPGPVQNVGIVQLSARASPRPAAMVRVRNDSAQDSARIVITGDAGQVLVQHDVALAATGEARDYMFDVKEAPNVLGIEVQVTDELLTDNRAWLVRGDAWPVIETRASVSPGLARIIDVYSRQRPANDRSPRVAVVDSIDRLPSTQPAVLISDSLSRGVEETVTTRPAQQRIVDHPITRDVRDWAAIAIESRTDLAPIEGWVPIVTVGDAVLLAVREAPRRQVWVRFDSPTFATSPDFAVFWTSVFDFCGGAPADGTRNEYRAEPVTDDALRWTRETEISGDALTAAPSPGVYRDDAGELHALNAIDVVPSDRGAGWTTRSSRWEGQLRALADQLPTAGGAKSIGRHLLIAALCLIVFSTALWGTKSRCSAQSAGGEIGVA